MVVAEWSLWPGKTLEKPVDPKSSGILTEVDIEFHTFTLPQARPIRVVIGGILVLIPLIYFEELQSYVCAVHF